MSTFSFVCLLRTLKYDIWCYGACIIPVKACMNKNVFPYYFSSMRDLLSNDIFYGYQLSYVVIIILFYYCEMF